MKFNTVARPWPLAFGHCRGVGRGARASSDSELEEVIVTAQYRAGKPAGHRDRHHRRLGRSARGSGPQERRGPRSRHSERQDPPAGQLQRSRRRRSVCAASYHGVHLHVRARRRRVHRRHLPGHADRRRPSTCSTWSASKSCAVRRARCSARTASAARSACSRKQPKGDDTGDFELTYGTSNRLDLQGTLRLRD